jgi:hypothetical protein
VKRTCTDCRNGQEHSPITGDFFHAWFDIAGKGCEEISVPPWKEVIKRGMFGSNDIVTRAQAAVILMQLHSSMKQFVGAPKSVTSEKKLPKRLFPEVYIKPALGSKTLITEFHEDSTLSVEGQFLDSVGMPRDNTVEMSKLHGDPEGYFHEDTFCRDAAGDWFFEYSEGELAKEQLIHNIMNFLI